MPNMKIMIDGNNKFKKLFDLEQLYFFSHYNLNNNMYNN